MTCDIRFLKLIRKLMLLLFYFELSAALGRVCLKLVIVMGITWIFDLLSWIKITLDGNRHSLWLIPDLINALHGVFIFIVVGCQPQVNLHIPFDMIRYILFLISICLSIIYYYIF